MCCNTTTNFHACFTKTEAHGPMKWQTWKRTGTDWLERVSTSLVVLNTATLHHAVLTTSLVSGREELFNPLSKESVRSGPLSR